MTNNTTAKNRLRLDIQDAFQKFSASACQTLGTNFYGGAIGVTFDEKDGFSIVDVFVDFASEDSNVGDRGRASTHEKIRSLALEMLRVLTTDNPSLTFKHLYVAQFNRDTIRLTTKMELR